MKTLLLVEDNEVEREGIATILRKSGYNVVAAPNGEDGLKLIEQHSPNLILLDMIIRGGMDGWRFLEHWKKSERHPPVIIVTGLGIASDLWARSLGASGLLKKPIDVEAMLKKVSEQAN